MLRARSGGNRTVTVPCKFGEADPVLDTGTWPERDNVDYLLHFFNFLCRIGMQRTHNVAHYAHYNLHFCAFKCIMCALFSCFLVTLSCAPQGVLSRLLAVLFYPTLFLSQMDTRSTFRDCGGGRGSSCRPGNSCDGCEERERLCERALV